MAHIHTLPDGQKTGTEIIDPDDNELHWHLVSEDKTSSSPFGLEHTHILNGVETSGPIQEKAQDMSIETKQAGGNILEAKQISRNGEPVGILKGYIATWDLDRGLDRFVRGAFAESLERHRKDNRPIRLKDHHGRTVGGFPIETVVENDIGLLGIGEVNLDVQQGRELMSLAKQGVLSDFSVGFTSIEDSLDNGIRVIHKAEIWEGSIVDEPMNPSAIVTEVKAAVPFQDLPLASKDRAWTADAAISRVREFTDSTDEPGSKYRRAFVWFDSADASNFGAYKLPIADVIDGRLTAVPRGVFAAAAAVQGARGGVDVPDADRAGVIRHLERYYAKMGLDSPFGDEKQFFVADDVKEWTERDIEKFLKKTGCMSKSAAKLLSDRLEEKEEQEETLELDAMRELVAEMKAFKSEMAN